MDALILHHFYLRQGGKAGRLGHYGILLKTSPVPTVKAKLGLKGLLAGSGNEHFLQFSACFCSKILFFLLCERSGEFYQNGILGEIVPKADYGSVYGLFRLFETFIASE